jgi:DNA repair protein RecN (Recombination protein N)
MEDLYYEAEDLAGEIRSYRDDLRYDPERLEAVEERLALLYRLKKKYAPAGLGGGDAEEAILAYRTGAEAEIEALAGAEENRDRLKAEIGLLEKDLAARAQNLSAQRNAAARDLEKRISGIIASLGMPNARFSVAVQAKRRETEDPASREAAGALLCGPWGADNVEFLISANKGEPLKELARIASGGELSRVLLAIKTVLAGADTLETLIFDEIDAGIGGEVALAVGDYLDKIGGMKQIFCVTHLASIAVRADNHLKVEKHNLPGDRGGEEGRTVTGVSPLETGERREEIARMLAGDAVGAAALAHADDLLAKYGRGQKT